MCSTCGCSKNAEIGVAYTGNETHDDYNEYQYVEQAPFGAENVRSYRYRGLIRDPHRKKSKRRDYSGVRRKAIKEMLGFGADYSQTGNVAADVVVSYEWTIFDMDDEDIENDDLLALIDSAVQDRIVYEYQNERDPSSQGITYVNYVNEDEKVEELNVYYSYDVNVELGAEDIPKEEQITQSGLIENPVGMAGKYWISRLTGAPDEKGQFHGRRGRRGYDKKPTMQDAISSSRKKVKKSEGYEPEPLNMQGAVGVLIALAGVVLYKL